jgi:hypothetical protein
MTNSTKERIKWKTLHIKDKIQYCVAVFLILTGVLMAFLSFFLNNYAIEDSILIYLAQCFITAGGIFGVSQYVQNQVTTLKSETASILKMYKPKEQQEEQEAA